MESKQSTPDILGLEPSKAIAIGCYLTIVGWLIALLFYGKYRSTLARFHLRQSLGLIVSFAVLAMIPLVGWLLTALVFIAWCMCIYYAALGEKYSLPVVGDFFQKHLDFI